MGDPANLEKFKDGPGPPPRAPNVQPTSSRDTAPWLAAAAADPQESDPPNAAQRRIAALSVSAGEPPAPGWAATVAENSTAAALTGAGTGTGTATAQLQLSSPQLQQDDMVDEECMSHMADDVRTVDESDSSIPATSASRKIFRLDEDRKQNGMYRETSEQ